MRKYYMRYGYMCNEYMRLATSCSMLRIRTLRIRWIDLKIDFEQAALRACELIVARDPRIGKVAQVPAKISRPNRR